MQVNVAGLRRNIKNLAHNYSDAQVKVREATSNDPWGPSATIMAEIADLTYNVVAFSEIMQMIWKRLNDHGKNWRHVYKALILLEYLIKTGTEKVSQQCKENIYAIQTLREFVYFEEGKDQGTHVREKAKQLVILLKDDERLKNERAKALKAKERFTQHPSGFGSDGFIDGPLPRDLPPGWQDEPVKPVSDLELVRPQTAGEEELQLQLAMAMSREEAEQEEAKRRSDDVRLQLALSQSEQDFNDEKTSRRHTDAKEEPQSHLLDLLDISLGAASISNPPLGVTSDPWGTPARAASQLSDPWTGRASPLADPWLPAAGSRNAMGIASGNGGSNGGVDIRGGEGGIISHTGDSWTGVRTQSPSLTSGSSNEGWLHSQGINGTMPQQQHTQQPQLIGNLGKEDPWESKRTATTPIAATSRSCTDPWISGADGTKSAPSVVHSGIDKSLIQPDPWTPATQGQSTTSWSNANNASAKKPSPDLDEFDVISNRNKNLNNNNASLLLDDLDPLSTTNTTALKNMSSATVTTSNDGIKRPLKDPQAFLGENSALVNLDNLIKPAVPYASPSGNNNAAAYNPFSDSTVIPPKTNLFQQPPVPSINQLKKQQPFTITMNQDPWAPVSNANTQMNMNNFSNNNNNNIEYTQSNLHQNYDAHSINDGLLFYPYSRVNTINSKMNTAYSKSNCHSFQSSTQFFNDATSNTISNNNADFNRLKSSDKNSEYLTQSLFLFDDDDATKKSSQNSQFLSSPSYPNANIICPNIKPDNNLKENFSPFHNSWPYCSNNNNNNATNQLLGPTNVSSLSTPIQPQSLSPPPPTFLPTKPATTAAPTILGSSSMMAETAFQSRSAAFTNPNSFASNYLNELQASLATTSGATIKPLLVPNETTNEMNFNEFFNHCNDNVNANNINAINILTNATTTNTTNERKLESNINNNYDKPWINSDTTATATASNPFL